MNHTSLFWKSSTLACFVLLSSSIVYADQKIPEKVASAPTEKVSAAAAEEAAYNKALSLIEQKKYREALELLKPIADGTGPRFQDASWKFASLHLADQEHAPDLKTLEQYIFLAAERSAEKNLKGNAEAQVHLGKEQLTLSGVVEKAWHRANRYFQWAAEQGNAQAWMGLGTLYQMTWNKYADPDPERALLCFQIAERMAPSEETAGCFGFFYLYQKDFASAVKWAELAIERAEKMKREFGEVSYLCGLAHYCAKDYAKARKYLLRSIEKNSNLGSDEQGFALLLLGGMAFRDLGMEPKPENKADAVAYFLKSARDFGNYEGAYQLACCYKYGYGVKKDPAAAAAWFNYAWQSENYKTFVPVANKIRTLFPEEIEARSNFGPEIQNSLARFGVLKSDMRKYKEKFNWFYGSELFWRDNGETPWLTPPMAESVRYPGWEFDRNAFSDEMRKNIAKKLNGDEGWKNGEYQNCPLDINLSSFTETMRIRSGIIWERARKMFVKAGYKECDAAATLKILKELGIAPASEEEAQTIKNSLWITGKDRYFLYRNYSGAQGSSDYIFLARENGKQRIHSAYAFSFMPDTELAAMVHGAQNGDPVSLNNLAVYWIEHGEFADAIEMEDIRTLLNASMAKGCAAAAYNLGRMAKREEWEAPHDAASYFAKAKEIAGSSMLYPGIQRPEVKDRNGALLVENEIGFQKRRHARKYVNGSSFASVFIGHTQVHETGPIRYEEGRSGIEYVIDMEKLTAPVYLTMDSTVQKRLEKTVQKITKETNPRYVSGLVISSKGELIASAQAPVFDLAKRRFLPENPNKGRDAYFYCDFIPAQYLFPVPNEWMKLLGSASNAAPESKEKFKFHEKTGVWQAEAQGIVLGLNKMAGETNPKKIAGQSATLLNYLLAYISVAEKKDVPKPIIYGMKKFAPVKPKEGIRWISFYRPPDGIVVNALGVIDTEDPNEKLYVVVRSVYEERNYTQKLPEDVVKAADADGDKAEAILRNDGI